MKLTEINKTTQQEIAGKLAPQLMTHPLFMFYCPDKTKREKFIDNYLGYNLYSWTKYGEAYASPDKNAFASLVNVNAFEYRFSGKNSLKLRLDKNAFRIFIHRETVEGIVNILIPSGMEARVLTFYCSPADNGTQIKALVEEITAHAREKGFAIAYETFSRKLIAFMEAMGFEVAYQRQFLDTQFVQTVMTYNVKKENTKSAQL